MSTTERDSLVAACATHGLPYAGTTSALRKRLCDHLLSSVPATPPPPPISPVAPPMVAVAVAEADVQDAPCEAEQAQERQRKARLLLATKMNMQGDDFDVRISELTAAVEQAKAASVDTGEISQADIQLKEVQGLLRQREEAATQLRDEARRDALAIQPSKLKAAIDKAKKAKVTSDAIESAKRAQCEAEQAQERQRKASELLKETMRTQGDDFAVRISELTAAVEQAKAASVDTGEISQADIQLKEVQGLLDRREEAAKQLRDEVGLGAAVRSEELRAAIDKAKKAKVTLDAIESAERAQREAERAQREAGQARERRKRIQALNHNLSGRTPDKFLIKDKLLSAAETGVDRDTTSKALNMLEDMVEERLQTV